MDWTELRSRLSDRTPRIRTFNRTYNIANINDDVEDPEQIKLEPTKSEQSTVSKDTTTSWDDLFRMIDNSQSTVQTTPQVTSSLVSPVSAQPIISYENNFTKNISDDLKTLLQMFSSNGIKVRVTSGYRPGAKTKQGKPSHHSTGNAIDVVPENGDFAALSTAIKENKDISNFMKSKGLGIIDETTPEMLAKTGGTGSHYHIGRDQIGLKFWI